jgi:hypothetical protein
VGEVHKENGRVKTYLLERIHEQHDPIKEKITDRLENLVTLSFNDGFRRKNFHFAVYRLIVKPIN